MYSTIHTDDGIVHAFSSYDTFMEYIYNGCQRDEYGLLIDECESGDCGVWQANFDTLKTHIDQGGLKNSKGFVRFEYQDDGHGRKLQLIDDAYEILGYIQGKLQKFIVHSNETKRYYIFWKKWLNEIDLSTNAILANDNEIIIELQVLSSL